MNDYAERALSDLEGTFLLRLPKRGGIVPLVPGSYIPFFFFFFFYFKNFKKEESEQLRG